MAEDSFCKTAMSRREDIVSCIDVTIMDRFAHSALPSPDSKIFHVADEQSPVGLDQAGAQFVQEIFSPIRDLGVNRSGSPSVTGALRAGHTDVQIPASAAVFTEVTRPQLEASQTVAVPQRQPPSRRVDLPPSIANRSDLEGNPTQGPACTATLAPGQSDFSMLPAPPRLFFRDLLHRLDGKIQGAVTARDAFEERPEIESRQKSPLGLEHFDRQFVAIIKDRVDLARQAAKPRRVLVLHPQQGVSSSLAGLEAGLSRGEIR
jgi:hypothetical protein